MEASGGLAALLPSGGLAAPFLLSWVTHQLNHLERVVIRQELGGQNKNGLVRVTLARVLSWRAARR